MNALICIGCNEYDHLRRLNGGEKDAREVFGALCQADDFYDKQLSSLLLSPTTRSVVEAINGAFPDGQEIDVFTFFFAGHGGVKNGSFFLCLRESDEGRLSTTSLPISTLFSTINELRPRQVNLIVDACGAGGSSFDLSQLSKPEVIGHSEASSITFLGACTSDQLAEETPAGGTLTQELLKCLRGEHEVQTRSPFLNLLETGISLSERFKSLHHSQKPILWGLSLFGSGKLSTNPHFNSEDMEKRFPTGAVLPASEMGQRIRANSAALWNEYHAIAEDPCPRRLLDLLHTIFREDAQDTLGMVVSIQGLAATLSTKSRESSELLAPSQCLATCAVSLLPHIDTGIVRTHALDCFREMMALDVCTWTKLHNLLKTEDHGLLTKADTMADLYYLPIRIARLLGWIGWSIVAESLMPELEDGNDSLRFGLAAKLVERYPDALVSVSDEQAPFLYVFLKACLFRKQTSLAEHVMNRFFGSFASKKGNVNRAGTDGVQAFRYILSLEPGDYQTEDWRPANPSYLLPVLLLSGVQLGLDSIWDLRAIDRALGAFFIPKSYRTFGSKIIDQGVNYTQHIGFNIWQLKEFKNEFERALQEGLTQETQNFSKEGVILCTLSSLLFPDRLPLLLERHLR